ncbi:unnamed protein product [Adineta ricciae]|nr:unnamed protein product [Adineta ricciae]
MLKRVVEFAKTIEDGSIVLFYYCGQCRQVDGANYLIPTDDDRMESDIVASEMGANAASILRKLTDKNESGVNIFILDCVKQYFYNCESPSNSHRLPKGLKTITSSNPVFIQFACGAGKIVSDNRKKNQENLFAEHLLNNIDREDVPIIDVFQNIAENVSQESKGKQRPFFMNGLQQYDQVCLYTMPDEQKIKDCNVRIEELNDELEDIAIKQPQGSGSYNRDASCRLGEIRALIHKLKIRRQNAIQRKYSTLPAK